MKLRLKLTDRNFLILSLTFIIITLQFSLTASKFKVKKKSLMRNKHKQISVPFSDTLLSNVGTNSNNSGSLSRDAVTYGTAGNFSRIPTNHPLITDLKRPKYVEQLHYYEDSPPRESETEAVSIDRYDEDYYRPFADKHLILEAKSVFNCETILSPYVCQESSLCGWDNYLKGCYYTNRVVHDIRFLQKEQKKKLKHRRK